MVDNDLALGGFNADVPLLELGMPEGSLRGLLLYLQRGPWILSWSLVEVPQFSPTGSWRFWVSIL